MSNNTSYENILIPLTFAGYVELFVCIIGLPANLAVLYLWSQIGRKGDDNNNSDARVHNNNHWFILGMTLADLLFTSIHAPMSAYWLLNVQTHDYGQECLLLFTATHTATTASSINVLLLNIDKFLYLYRPLRYYCLVTKRRAITAFSLGWMIAVMWALAFTFGPFNTFNGRCSQMDVVRTFDYIVFYAIFFMLPISVSLFISVYIATIAIRASKDAAFACPIPDGNNEIRSSLTSRQSILNLRLRLKTIAFIFITTIWCTMTCLPYRIVFSLQKFDVIRNQDYPWLFYIPYSMWAMTAAGNPLITMFVQPHFRRQRKKSMRFLLPDKGVSKNSSYTAMTAVNGQRKMNAGVTYAG